MADVKWIRIATDMFNNRKIKQIRKMPDGDALLVIWMQTLCLSGQINDNGLMHFSKDIPFTDEMLATEFDRPIQIIRLALTTFEKFGMIEVFNNILIVSNWEKYQSADKLQQIREQNRVRQQKFKENQKLLSESNVTVTLPVTQGNATELELELELELDKDKDIKIYSSVIDYLNLKCNTKYKTSSAKTKSLIDARVNDKFTLEDFKKVIDIKSAEWLNDAERNKYLRPETLFGNKFEGYLNQKIAVKQDKPQTTTKPNKFHNFDGKMAGLGESQLEEIARRNQEKFKK